MIIDFKGYNWGFFNIKVKKKVRDIKMMIINNIFWWFELNLFIFCGIFNK